MDFVVDIVEAQDGIVFATGYVSAAIAKGYTFRAMTIYQPAKKKRQNPKKLSSQQIELTVHTILFEGEPLETLAAERTAQIGLTGDATPLMSLLEAHQWHQSNGRYFLPRKETRLISLSGA